MNYDWYSSYSENIINEIKKLNIDSNSKIKLLTANKQRNQAKEDHIEIIKNEYCSLIDTNLNFIENIGIKIPKIKDFNIFFCYSFFIQFTFTLAAPYISKDDDVFYICDNPIRKDKVFKVPIISGSSWKGNLRWTLRQILGLNSDKKDTKEITGLFGNKKDKENNFRRGRLNFYPTFFEQISFEVINPHDRKTKAGTIPVYIESVPAGATGTFSLLYVPFDLIGIELNQIKETALQDLGNVYESLKEMMLIYGFSAKKSSGFGIIKENISGSFRLSGVKFDIQNDLFKFVKRSEIKQQFNNFDELGNLIQRINKAMKDERNEG